MSVDAKPTPEPELPANAVELLRAWVIDGDLHCQLNIGPADEDATIVFAILLSDVARHVADAVHQSQGVPVVETLNRLRQHFSAELNAATATPEGGFVC